MDTVEIVVEGRKGVNEHKALKILGKFLKQDQEKDVDDQVRRYYFHWMIQRPFIIARLDHIIIPPLR